MDEELLDIPVYDTPLTEEDWVVRRQATKDIEESLAKAAEQAALRNSAMKKLLNLGITEEELQALTS